MSPVLRLLLASLVALGACTSAAPTRGQDGPDASPLQTAFQGLCDAGRLAEEGDVQAAAEAFLDRSHAYLHELAVTLSDRDRDAAAGLLEAKQRVEAVFADPASADPAGVAALIGDLRVEVAEGAEIAGLPEPECEEGR